MTTLLINETNAACDARSVKQSFPLRVRPTRGNRFAYVWARPRLPGGQVYVSAVTWNGVWRLSGSTDRVFDFQRARPRRRTLACGYRRTRSASRTSTATSRIFLVNVRLYLDFDGVVFGVGGTFRYRVVWKSAR